MSDSIRLMKMLDLNHERLDGRAFNELRPFEVTFDPMGFALSSLILKSGRTSVLCSVSLEESVPAWREGKNAGWLKAEYRFLPASTPSRQERELLNLSGRTQEIQRLISRSLRAVLNLEALGEKTLLIDCDVIQADAGTRTASITGAWMALEIACKRLLRSGELNQNPIEGQVAAVSVGLVKGSPFIDLDYNEDSKADVDLNVVMDNKGMLLEVQGTAEGSPFSRQELNKLLDIAESGIASLQQNQITALQHQR